MAGRGNVNIMTVMGDALMDGLSDAGSIPARSIENRLKLRGKTGFRRFFIIESFHKEDIILRYTIEK